MEILHNPFVLCDALYSYGAYEMERFSIFLRIFPLVLARSLFTSVRSAVVLLRRRCR